MAKSADAFRTISEVADWLGVPTHVLRFWESKFPQVKPVKRAGGRRYYRPSDMVLLAGIRVLLHDDGVTIRGVQKVLREKGVKHVAGLADRDVADDGVMIPESRASRAVASEDMDAAETPASEIVVAPEATDDPGPQADAAVQDAEASQSEDPTLFDDLPKDTPETEDPAAVADTQPPDPEPAPDPPAEPQPAVPPAALPDLPGPSPSGSASLKPLLAQLASADPDTAAEMRASLRAHADALTALRDRMAEAPSTTGSGTDA